MEETTMDKDQSEILRYFNLYNSGTYIMTEGNPLEADHVLPIKSDQRNGFLLQCYDSGHINKVFVSTLLARKINKEYMSFYLSFFQFCNTHVPVVIIIIPPIFCALIV